MTSAQAANLLRRSSSLGSDAVKAQKQFLTEYKKAVGEGKVPTAAEQAQYKLYQAKADTRSASSREAGEHANL